MEHIKVDHVDIGEDVSTVILEKNDEERLLMNVKAGARILVDSDQFAFVYILEDTEHFYSLRFEQDCWSALSEAHQKETAFFAEISENTRLALVDFNEELAFLLDNIQGNGNYGEAFEQAVGAVFY
ncbi:hypothetical protein [Bacillus sp. JCM 19041]|uniref:UPF0738 family protein n=1 Tax=Bacillus sp. JCM 19041 TaxID=1460637 RepID=UPI0006D12D59